MNVSRAQYTIIQTLIAAVRNADTAFSCNKNEHEMTSYDLGKIGKHVANEVSFNQIENCICLLQVAQRQPVSRLVPLDGPAIKKAKKPKSCR